MSTPTTHIATMRTYRYDDRDDDHTDTSNRRDDCVDSAANSREDSSLDEYCSVLSLYTRRSHQLHTIVLGSLES